jgi:peptide/nickel transport system substrate-binding protein
MSPTRSTVCLALAAAVSMVAVGCSSSKGSSNAATTTTAALTQARRLTVPFLADMGVPDPDVFYASEGLGVIEGSYEGLLQYSLDNRNKIVPLLATSYDVSSDAMTYTFHLRRGVTFHDGTPFTSAAAKASFERRVKVNNAPAYMLADVATMDTPDPATFVVKLKEPVSAFPSYLASPYGPRMISPTVLTNDAGSDYAQTYLKTHDAGTGPYTISSWVPNQRYTLTRYDGYWGAKPAISEIDIPIVTDISTQSLELQGGQLDMIVHGLQPTDLTAYKANPKVTVSVYPALLKTMAVVNPNKAIFSSLAVRQALAKALDKAGITRQAFGQRGTVSTQIYPAGMLAPPGGTDVAGGDPAALAAAVSALRGKTVDIGWDDADPVNGRLADLVGLTLQRAGLKYQSRTIPDAQTFDLPSHPDKAPDILITTINPDAGHPDTWVRIYMSTKGNTNYLNCSVPAADALMDKGLHAVDPAAISADYAQAGSLLVQSGCWDTITDVQDVVVARRGVTGIEHQIPANSTIWFAGLTATP